MHYSRNNVKNLLLFISFFITFWRKRNQNIKNIDNKNSNSIVDPRHKIESYLEKLCINYQKYFILGKNIIIDESLLHFTGRNNMKYYIPIKPHKWGFKIHMLCDSDRKYLYIYYLLYFKLK